MLVFSIWDRANFDALNSMIKLLKEHWNESTQFILIGNKLDLEEKREVSIDEAKKFADENSMLYFEVSAKTGENVEYAFLETLKSCKSAKDKWVIKLINESLEKHLKNTKKLSLIEKIANIFK